MFPGVFIRHVAEVVILPRELEVLDAVRVEDVEVVIPPRVRIRRVRR